MRYKNNYLTNVIFRLDFNPISALLSERELEFTKKIKNKYPYVTSKPTEVIKVSASDTTHSIERQQRGLNWEHRQAQGKEGRLVVAGPDYLSVEYPHGDYTEFNDFINEIEEIFNIFNGLYKVGEVSRMGLRYINQISINTGNALDWDNLINPSLVTGIKAGLDVDMKMLRSMHQLQAVKDDISVIFNYGIHNPEFPNPVARREFILDYDCYITGGLASNEIIDKAGDLNKIAEKMFEDSVEQGLRDLMEAQKNE